MYKYSHREWYRERGPVTPTLQPSITSARSSASKATAIGLGSPSLRACLTTLWGVHLLLLYRYPLMLQR
jgi:hypothetical protein